MTPYDPECLTLAKHFLSEGTDADQDSLAQAIQEAVEDWHRDREQ